MKQPVTISANLTPMIDVTFLLIIFFVLVSQIVDLESVQLDLPSPEDPASEIGRDEKRAVISVVPGPGGRAAGYRLGGRRFAPDPAGLESMVGLIVTLYGNTPELSINLRADRRTHYEAVKPVLDAVARAGRLAGRETAPAVNLVLVREQ